MPTRTRLRFASVRKLKPKAKNRKGSALKPGSQKRVKGQCPLQDAGTASLLGFGATPQPFRVKPTQRKKSTKVQAAKRPCP